MSHLVHVYPEPEGFDGEPDVFVKLDDGRMIRFGSGSEVDAVLQAVLKQGRSAVNCVEYRLTFESVDGRNKMSRHQLVALLGDGRYRHSLIASSRMMLEQYRAAAVKRGGTNFSVSRRTATTTYGPWEDGPAPDSP